MQQKKYWNQKRKEKEIIVSKITTKKNIKNNTTPKAIMP